MPKDLPPLSKRSLIFILIDKRFQAKSSILWLNVGKLIYLQSKGLSQSQKATQGTPEVMEELRLFHLQYL